MRRLERKMTFCHGWTMEKPPQEADPPRPGISRRTVIGAAAFVGIGYQLLEMLGMPALAFAAGRYGDVRWPCNPHPTPTRGQVYGSPRNYPGGHKGSDYGVDTGTAVVAISSGTVSAAARNDVEGRYVTIQHDNGTRSHCIHLSRLDVTRGARVNAGQQIGLSGADGNAAEGAHLHIEIYEGSTRYDPHAWLLANVGPANKGPLMALSDAEQAELLNTVRAIAGFLYAGGTDAAAGNFDNNSVIGRVRSLQDATFYGGTSMQDAGKSMSQSLAEINRKLP